MHRSTRYAATQAALRRCHIRRVPFVLLTTLSKEEAMSTTRPVDWVELARRASDGLEVVLLWDRSTDRVKVAVNDERICHHLDLEVNGAQALSAFYHPFAHAAERLARRAPEPALAS
jgi:hypothetical protein